MRSQSMVKWSAGLRRPFVASRPRRPPFGFAAAVAGILAVMGEHAVAADDAPASGGGDPAAGRQLFLREWLPRDPRSHGGDGLGPLFNETSCVACHNQGGAGGSGSAARNVELLSASASPQGLRRTRIRRFIQGSKQIVKQEAEEGGAEPKLAFQVRDQRELLAKVHPGFCAAPSVVLHRHGLVNGYQEWRSRFSPDAESSMIAFFVNPGEPPVSVSRELDRLRRETLLETGPRPATSSVEGLTFLNSLRNAPALFGSGLIDSIPEEAIVAGAAREHEGFSEVSGRVARLRDGRLGRFGWKGQEASLGEFVLTACAIELGLHVPGRPQAAVPQDPGYQAPGLDLTAAECADLTAHVASLPRPVEHAATLPAEEEFLRRGRTHFREAGCAACHTPDLGGVRGLYSDLLLHDLGQALGDSASYGGLVPDLTDAGAKPGGATPREWRTPPLWGVRDSAPYLHDGRAGTLEQAIAFHDGEARLSAERYFSLASDDRQAVNAFLKSLQAPQ